MSYKKALILLVAALSTSGCPGPLDMAEAARKKVAAETAKASRLPTLPAESAESRLVVDVTLSMAGYIAPPGQPASAFSRALETVASALPGHELFVFGTQRAGEQASLDELLAPRAGGLGQEFASDELFRGANNQDDLLFQALGREQHPKPLILLTDGVYSSPSGQGIQPVALALDNLIKTGWSLGLIALRSSYYGTRCELISGQGCRGERLFYSEASTQQGGRGFVSLPCPVLHARPFYVIVLSPSAETFNKIHDALKEKLEIAATFLLGGGKSPVDLAEDVEPVDKESLYDKNSSLHWLMLARKGESEPAIRVKYSMAPSFPVERVGWSSRGEQALWNGRSFDQAWAPASFLSPVLEDDEEKEALPAGGTAGRLLWRSFARDFENLQSSFAGQIQGSGDLASLHPDAVRAVKEWQPADLGALYCEYLDQPSLEPASRPLSILRVLLVADALRRQQPEELVSGHLGSLLLSPSASEDADLGALAKDLARVSNRAVTTLATVTVPAGRPPSPAARPATAKEAPELKALKATLPRGDQSTTYKLLLVPRTLRFSQSLAKLSTSDDSDIAFSDRTYRLDRLVEYLVTAELERMGSRGDLAVYVTVPGR